MILMVGGFNDELMAFDWITRECKKSKSREFIKIKLYNRENQSGRWKQLFYGLLCC